MDSKTTREIWYLLEANLKQLENDSQVESDVFRETEAAVGMLLECDPAEVLLCIDDSPLPTRAIVSWLAFEGGRMGMSAKAGALVSRWTQRAQGVEQPISPPSPTMG